MKRLIIFVLIIAGLIGAAIAAAPLIAASDFSKRRIATQIENWTGRPVTFTGQPTVKLFPFISLTVEDAVIGDAPEAGGDHLIVVEKLTSKLRLLPFLIGRVDVAEFQFVRPHLRLSVDAQGQNNWRIKHVSAPPEPVANRKPDRPSQIAETRLGRFKIIDGTVTYDNKRNGHHETLSNVSALLSWPEITGAISGTGQFTWRGEIVEFNSSITDPLKLIAGDVSAVRFALASKLLRASFNGTADSVADLQLEGTTSVTTPSVRRVAEWLGAVMDEGSIFGAGLIDGNLNWTGPSISFSDAKFELDGNSAAGTTAIDFSGQRPVIKGIFFLESLDLTAYHETLQASIAAAGPWQLVPVSLPFLSVVDADIRIAAGQMLLGTARLGTSTTLLTIKDGRFAVSIGEAQFYGGTLEASADVSIANAAMTVSTGLTLENTPIQPALSELAGSSLADGILTARIELGGRGKTWGALAMALAGEASLSVADGMLIGTELSEIAGLIGGFGIVEPAEGTGTVPFKSLEGALTFANGVIKSSDIHADGESFAIDIGGQVSLIDTGLRANGVLTASKANAGADERKIIPFFVGGSWNAPLLLPDYEHLIQRGAEKSSTSPPAGSASRPLRPKG